MSQILEYTWTNPSTVVPVQVSVGFAIARVTVYDTTLGNIYIWLDSMAANQYLQIGTTGLNTTGGFTPNAPVAYFGAPISAMKFGEGQNNITCLFINPFGFQVGDSVLATDIVEEGEYSSNNGFYTISSIQRNVLTCSPETPITHTNTYIGGGVLVRVKDSNNQIVPIKNYARYGGTIGLRMAGGANSKMVAIFEGRINVI